MSLEAIHERRLLNAGLLRQLFYDLKKYNRPLLNKSELQTFGIKTSHLDLLSNQTKPVENGEFQFFQPLPSSSLKFIAPVDEAELRYFKSSLAFSIARETDQNIDIFLESADFNQGLMKICNWREGDGNERFGVPGLDNSSYEWRMFHAYDTFTRENPHQVIRSAHGIEPNRDVAATITRSELILLVATIMSRMAMPSLIDHEIYPILLVSSCSYQTRFVQGYFDGETLHVAFSEFLNHEPDPKKYKDLILRWLLSDPVGNTKISTHSPEKGTGLALPGKSVVVTPVR